MSPNWSRHRRWETLSELDRLQDELKLWGERRRDARPGIAGDARGQYVRQLEVVEAEVGEALKVIRASASNVSDGDAGELAVGLARVDRQVIWLRQAWEFLRAKFDQRDDPELRPVLQAADEVIWSCYKPLFGQTASVPVPPPLPCIEFDYAPTSILRDHGHVLPRLADVDGVLDQYFEKLPIDVLRLPPSAVSSPWGLALIAHEIGHAVLPVISPDGSYADALGKVVAGLARARGIDGVSAGLWSSSAWIIEMFADWYSVPLLGPWAVWAVANVEFADDGRMRTRRTSYPSAFARLAFLTGLCHEIGIESAWRALQEFSLTTASLDAMTGDAAADIAVARDAAKRFARFPLPDGRSLTNALGFRAHDFDDQSRAAPSLCGEWACALAGLAIKADQPSTRSPRLVLAGAVRARAEASERDGPDATKRIGEVRRTTFARIAANADPATRTAAQKPPEPERVPLATRLMNASDNQLFAR